MIFVRFACIVIILSNLCYGNADLPPCKPTEDFHYEYTQCDSQGRRWRVQVPDFGKCKGGSPQPPERAPDCNFRCEPGQYLDKNVQKCKDCLQGTYSLDGGKRYDTWEKLPEDFSIRGEPVFDSFLMETGVNCSASPGLMGKKDYLIASPNSCIIQLNYVANLVKEGYVSFRYLFDKSTSAYFEFSIKNQVCQSQKDEIKVLRPSNDWILESKMLKPGLNFLTWKIIPLGSNTNTLQNSIFIQSIEITGLAFVSECTDCPAGSYSDKPKSRECTLCPRNTYSNNLGSTTCKDCEPNSYSFEGSAGCSKKKPCQDADYKMVEPICKDGKTDIKYAWLEPKICDDKHKDSIKLPQSKKNQDCPPCNPGMQLVDGVCEFCPEGYYSENGIGKCLKCPSTKKIGNKQLIIQNFDTIPEKLNMSTSCLGDSLAFCISNNTWKPNGDYISTTNINNFSTYSLLKIKLGGFNDQAYMGQDTVFSDVKVTYDTSCKKNCTLYFITLNEFSKMGFSDSMRASDKKITSTFRLKNRQYTTLMWAFKKNLPDDVVRIYQIRVTNVINGGATRCSNCTMKEVKDALCDQCPPGQIMRNGTECKPCPENTIVSTNGAEPVCVPCAEGLRAVDGQKCVASCTYKKPNGRLFDFTKMASAPVSVNGTRSFTPSGFNYYYQFNISLCAGEVSPPATCRDEVRFNAEKSVFFRHKFDKQIVTSSICQSAVLPSSNPEQPSIITQPESLGDVLLNVSSDPKPMNMLDKMKKAKFDPPENPYDDTYFTFYSERSSSACKQGRYTIVILRCDALTKTPGEIIPAGASGTYDGCTFMFLWKSIGACPACKDSYTEVEGACINRKKIITYVSKDKHCILLNDAPPPKTLVCSPIPKWLLFVIGFIFITGILLCSMLIYCWKKNRKLEYKYSKLIGKKGSNSEEAEMPAPETCALDSSEEEEFDSVKIVEGKGKRMFNKLLGKTKSNPFESINLTSQEKEPLT